MARDLELALRVRADMNKAVQEVRKLRRDLKQTGRTSGAAAREARGLARAWDRAGGAMAGARRHLTGIKSLIAVLGLAVAIRGITAATIRQEQAIAQVEARIRATGGAAGLASDDLQRMAAELQQVTAFGDEAVLEMQALLLSFREIRGDTFRDATEAVLDLAIGVGTDLRSAAIQLGKALNDPAAGLDGLSRSGTTFTETQKDLIKSLAEAGRTAEAQAIILEEIRRQYGGAARAARDTLGGALAALSNAWGDLLEQQDGTGRLREEIEKLVSLLQDPATIAGAQELGTALFEGLSAVVDQARALGIAISRITRPDDPDLEILDLLRTRALDEADLERYRTFNSGPDANWLLEFWDNTEIDARIEDILQQIHDAGGRIPEALADGIRRSGADVDAALVERLDIASLSVVAGGAEPADSADETETPAAESEAATKRIAALERELALKREIGREQRVLWEIERGRLSEASDVQRAKLLGLARELDLIDALAEEERERFEAAEEASERHKTALAEIETAGEALVTPYARARAEIERWKRDTLAALDQSAAGWEEYANRVERVTTERLARAAEEEAERRLRASRRWQDGARRGLQDYASAATDAAARAEDAVTGWTRRSEDALAQFATTGKLNFRSLTDSIIADMARIAIQQSITGPLAGFLGGLFGGVPASPASGPGSHHPAVFHSGGIAGAPGGVRRALPAGLFDHAPRYHGGGIAGRLRSNEIPAVLERGEEVVTEDDPRHIRNLTAGPREVTVTVISQGTPQRETDVRARMDPSRMVIELFIDDVANRGPLAGTLEGVYGLSRSTGG